MGATYKPNVNLNNRKSTREMFMSSSQSTYKKEDFMTIQITGNAKEIAALITELQGQKEKATANFIPTYDGSGYGSVNIPLK